MRKYSRKNYQSNPTQNLLPFNVFFGKANHQRAEALRQQHEHHLFLLKQRRNPRRFSKVPNASSKTNMTRKPRNHSTFKSSKVQKKYMETQGKRDSQKNIQTNKGTHQRQKFGGKHHVSHFKREFQKVQEADQGNRLLKNKKNKWNPKEKMNNRRGFYENFFYWKILI